MSNKQMHKTIEHIFKRGKGLLAADESTPSCKKRFDAVGIECTEEARRQYRQLLLTAPGANKTLSGIIFFEETFWQSTDNGTPFYEYAEKHGILPGIKLDQDLEDLPGFQGEKLTKGLDSLPDRIRPFAQMGAKFAKWRSVITIGDEIPTKQCIEANAFVLARYARICQDNGVVPIVEPEVLFEGHHSIEQSEMAHQQTLKTLFSVLKYFRVDLSSLILKTSMVLPGKDTGQPINHDEVAGRTVKVLHAQVPSEVGGIVFLSGGQTSGDSFNHLHKMIQLSEHPWPMTFSYSRAIQDPVLKTWAKNTSETEEAIAVYIRQLQMAHDSALGKLEVSGVEDDFVSAGQDL